MPFTSAATDVLQLMDKELQNLLRRATVEIIRSVCVTQKTLQFISKKSLKAVLDKQRNQFIFPGRLFAAALSL